MQKNVFLRCGKCNTLLAVAFLSPEFSIAIEEQKPIKILLFECPNQEFPNDEHTVITIDLTKIKEQ
jgi:hypothetical protein